MYILATAVTPTVVLQQVNVQSASHFVRLCVKAAKHPDFTTVQKKERIFEDSAGGLQTLPDHLSQ